MDQMQFSYRSAPFHGDSAVSSAINALLLFPSEKPEVDESNPDLPCSPGYTQRVSVSVPASVSTEARRSEEEWQESLTALYELCLSIDERFARTERALQRTEALVADRTLLDLCRRIDERLLRSEREVRALQKSVANLDRKLLQEDSLHVRSAHVESGLAKIDDATHDIKRFVEEGSAERASSQPVGGRAESDVDQIARDVWLAIRKRSHTLSAVSRPARIILLLGIVAMLSLVGSPNKRFQRVTPVGVLQIAPVPGP
jgi:hypothetical protein